MNDIAVNGDAEKGIIDRIDRFVNLRCLNRSLYANVYKLVKLYKLLLQLSRELMNTFF